MERMTFRLTAVLLALGVVMAGVLRAEAAKGAQKEVKIDVEAIYTGTVEVTKDGDTVKSIKLIVDSETTYEVKLNGNGLKLKEFDGKKVKVRGVMRKTDNGLLLTARECSELHGEKEGKAESNAKGKEEHKKWFWPQGHTRTGLIRGPQSGSMGGTRTE